MVFNSFTRHGLMSTSASQAASYLNCPGKWLAEKFLDLKWAGNCATERGKQTENGIVHVLKGKDFDTALKLALAGYDNGTRFYAAEDPKEERENIAPMMKLGLEALKPFGEPEWAEGASQHKVEMDLQFGEREDDHIPVVGYLDLSFPDHIVDIKTTTKMPSAMSLAHRMQSGVYQRISNKPVSFLYLTPKKSALLTDPNPAQSQATFRAIVSRMGAFLSLSDDIQVLRAAVPVMADSYAWRGLEEARRRLYGV
jgi:hypothetical protein